MKFTTLTPWDAEVLCNHSYYSDSPLKQVWDRARKSFETVPLNNLLRKVVYGFTQGNDNFSDSFSSLPWKHHDQKIQILKKGGVDADRHRHLSVCYLKRTDISLRRMSVPDGCLWLSQIINGQKTQTKWNVCVRHTNAYLQQPTKQWPRLLRTNVYASFRQQANKCQFVSDMRADWKLLYVDVLECMFA